MNKLIKLIFAVAFSAFVWPAAGFSETKYFSAKVERVEVCKSDGMVYVYFKDIVGTTPSASNGCSNDLNIPSVKLSASANAITEPEKLMASLALSALIAERSVRVRFDDATKNVASIAID